MAIKETCSNTAYTTIASFFSSHESIGNETAIVDTANFDNGITFAMILNIIGGDATFTVIDILESNDAAMAPQNTNIASACNLVGNLEDMVLTKPMSDNEKLPAIGAVGTKRYMKLTYDVEFINPPDMVVATILAIKA